MSYPSAATRPPGSKPIGCTARPVRSDQARPSEYDHSLPALSVATDAGKSGLAVNSLTRCRHTASIRPITAAATGGSTRHGPPTHPSLPCLWASRQVLLHRRRQP